jgi:hypothetical protein
MHGAPEWRKCHIFPRAGCLAVSAVSTLDANGLVIHPSWHVDRRSAAVRTIYLFSV